MREGLSIAAAHGYPLDDRWIRTACWRGCSHHKPSLLQDYEQRRPMEIGEMVLAPIAFARAAKLATPTLDALGAIVSKLAKDGGWSAADVGDRLVSPHDGVGRPR